MKKYYNILLIILITTLNSFSQINLKPYLTFHTGSSTNGITIGDINNDKLDDIVVINGESTGSSFNYKLLLYFQTEEGNLGGPEYVNYPESDWQGASSIAINDMNNNSLNDIIIGFSDSLLIYFQNSFRYGSFDSTLALFSGEEVDAFEIADMNNDNYNDIVVMHGRESYLRVFYQTSSGEFNLVDYPAPDAWDIDLEIADIDNNQFKDILFVARGGNSGFYIMKQNSSEVFSSPIQYQLNEYSITGLAVEDLNNDELKDVLITRSSNFPAYVLIYYNNGASNFFENVNKVIAYDIPRPISVHDLNCDGSMEIILAHGGWHALSIYDKAPRNEYNEYQKFENIYGNYKSAHNPMAFGDLNGDSSPDIALASGDKNWVLFYNDSKPYVTDSFQVKIPFRIDTTCHSITKVFTEKIDSIDNYEIIRNDSAIINYTNIDTYGYDYKMQIRDGKICSGAYRDSVKSDSIYYGDYTLISDTLIYSSSYDTVYYTSAERLSNLINSVKIYPNPANGNINVLLSNIQYNSQFQLSVFSNLGQLIYFENKLKQQYNIKLPGDGIFFIKLVIDKKVSVTKIINNAS